MPSSDQPPDNPLRDLLKEAETELSRRLHEACEAEARGVASESAQEIRDLEDSLLSAAMAAEQVITARRHLRRSTQAAEAQRDAAAEAAPQRASGHESASEETAESASDRGTPKDSEAVGPEDASTSNAVREFEDETGRSWRAWPVTPNLARAQEASRRSLGDFQEGWICFEALDNSGRRRLPRLGRRWSDLPPEELPRLLAEAINVPERKPRRAEGQAGGSSGAMS